VKSIKSVIVLLVVVLGAAACATPTPAPSYLPSPFAGMHGQ